MLRPVFLVPVYVVWLVSTPLLAQSGLGSESGSGSESGLQPESGPDTNQAVEVVQEQRESAPQPAAGKTWRDFFRSSRNKREQLQADGDYESLAAETGNAAWSAASQYRQGDYQSAIESFSALPGEEALYNSATAYAQAGDYKQSLQQYDQLLQQNPQHEDGLHNRAIVEQLQKLQEEQEQQQQQDEKGEQDEQDEQQQDGESQSGEGGGQQQPQDAEQQQGESGSADLSQQQPGAEAEQPEAQPDLDQLQQAQESAEQQQQARLDEQQLDEQRQQALQELAEEMPMNEQQQATEQWLRQIPDDPSGLLRRKLERSHLTDHPRVKDSEQPW